MNKNYLPIGSVVTLKEATKKLMIIGISIKRQDDENIYDYIGTPYPEGYIDSETMFLFMHNDIDVVDFVGFINSEAQVFRKQFEKLVNN